MNLFIFGSTGDLVRRKVLPSLHNFKNLKIYALGRKDLDNDQYRDYYCKECTRNFKENLNYLKFDFNNDFYIQLIPFLDKRNINYFYISMHPEFTLNILKQIKELKNLNFKIDILIEKPFGSSLKEAKILQKYILKNNLRREVFLADHYMFKEVILNLNSIEFKQAELVGLEELGLEGRSYYDSVGALKDMIQSHFMNIAFKMMRFTSKDIRVLEFKRGQYRLYNKELGKLSLTETYVKLTLKIKDKIIIFETGKKFNKKASFIQIDNIKHNLESMNNPYVKMFNDFFKQDSSKFPTIENAINSWKIIEKIEKSRPTLFYY
jgi:glucose-6-phosphate 1-dehydrogenase